MVYNHTLLYVLNPASWDGAGRGCIVTICCSVQYNLGLITSTIYEIHVVRPC